MILNLVYDSSVGSAPAGFTAALNSAVSFFQNTFRDPVTVNIAVGYGEVDGQSLGSNALGSSLTYFNSYAYSQVRAALAADAQSADDASSLSSLPLNNPNGGNYWMTTAQAKAAGLQGSSSHLDGYVGFTSSPILDFDSSNGISAGQYDFFGVIVHEITEVMGRQLMTGERIGGAPGYGVLDLFHFSSPGVHSFAGAQSGYFSVDNGVTNLDNFNTNPNGDYGDWAGSAGNDAALAFSHSGVVNAVTATDLKLMDVIGWDVGLPATPIAATGPITLAAAGNHFSLLDSNGSGPSLKYSGSDVTAGQFGAWTPIGAAKTASGYEIAWKVSGADQYTLWSTDAGGNYVANIVGKVPGTDVMLMSSENLFQQDLNGDGHIGLGATASIETAGATSLAGVGNRFGLLDSNGAGPSLKDSGSDVVAGQFGAWTPIGAEKTASGYEIAWKLSASDQYTLWNTDANGNYIANIVGKVAGTDVMLMSSENPFHQDLNGDGHIGLGTTTSIEATGATNLAAVGNRFGLLDSAGVGPSLKDSGSDVVAGQYGAWTPIGAEQTASGYEIAWKLSGANEYTLWNTDANGNYTANLVGAVSGSSSELMSSESLFHQDFNGDGIIGVPDWLQ